MNSFDTIRDPYLVVAGNMGFPKPQIKKSPEAEKYLDGYLDELRKNA